MQLHKIWVHMPVSITQGQDQQSCTHCGLTKNPKIHFKTIVDKNLPSLVPFLDYPELVAVLASFSVKYQFMKNIFMNENNQEADGVTS